MKHFLLIAGFCSLAAAAFAGPGDSGLGLGGFMDDLIKPYDDTAVDLPGEDTRKPSVSRSAQLVDDEPDAWNSRETGTKSKTEPEKKSAQPGTGNSGSGTSSSYSSGTSSDDGERADNSPLSRWNTVGEDGEVKFTPFKNDYRYKGGTKPTSGTRPEFEETRKKIKEIMGDGVPKVMVDARMDELIHSPTRESILIAPTTPEKWIQAPNGWFCDYDDALSKAEKSGRALAVFFHSSANDVSRRFKTERMENNKFKSQMKGRLLVVYLDFPDPTKKDRREQSQIDHNQRIAEQYHVNSYPTVVFLNKDGKEVGRVSGTKSLNDFLNETDRYVPQKSTTDKNSGGFKIGGSIGFGETPPDYSSD